MMAILSISLSRRLQLDGLLPIVPDHVSFVPHLVVDFVFRSKAKYFHDAAPHLIGPISLLSHNCHDEAPLGFCDLIVGVSWSHLVVLVFLLHDMLALVLVDLLIVSGFAFGGHIVYSS